MAAYVAVLGWIALVAVVAVLGSRQSDFASLKAAVAEGQVTEVVVDGGLSLHSRGFTVVTVHWREGLVRHWTEVVETSAPRRSHPSASEEVTGVVHRPLVEVLRDLDPTVHVTEHRLPSSTSGLMGWTVPGLWAGFALLYLWAHTLLLIAVDGEPRHATRWAWRWLVLLVPPLGALAYLWWSGARDRTMRFRATPGRLTGGWAFLVAFVLGRALGLWDGA